MNESESETFYKIKLFYKSDRLLNIEKQLEYHLSRHPSNFKYSLYKFVDNQLVYTTGDRSNRMVRNLYNILKNIEKLSVGKIKKYQIFTQLELEILCHYLKSKNILHTIQLNTCFQTNKGNKIYNYNILYDEYIEKLTTYKTYFRQNGMDYERNKIINYYQLYIQVYKGFINLFDKKYMYQKSENPVEMPKYGVYIWPNYPVRNV
jgi:hypothetical protein